MKMTVIPIVIGTLGTIIKGLAQGLKLGNKRTSGNYLNYSLVKIGQNTEKSSGYLRRLAVTQTSDFIWIYVYNMKYKNQKNAYNAYLLSNWVLDKDPVNESKKTKLKPKI